MPYVRDRGAVFTDGWQQKTGMQYLQSRLNIMNVVGA